MTKWIKPLCGLAIVFYVLRSGIVDFGALRDAWRSPGRSAAAIALVALSNVLLATRWFLLLRAQGLQVRWRRAQQIHWATAFVSLVLPGSVGSDLAKIWYVVGESSSRKTEAIGTLFVDRVLGSTTLLFTAAGALAVFRADLALSPQLALLAPALWSAAGVLAFGHATLWLIPRRWTRLLDPVPLPWVKRAVESLLAYRERPGALLLGAMASVASLASMACLCALESHWLGVGMSGGRFAYIVPLVSLIGYFNFLPLGIGVGQLVYFQLFRWLGVLHPELGATLSTVIQLATLIVNLAGGLAFQSLRRGQPDASAETLRRAS